MSLESSHESDLCFRGETAKLLALNIAQIHTGMLDGDNSIEQIGESFQELARFCMNMQQNKDASEATKELAQQMMSKVDGAIIAFQFYDRLAQRLSHVQKNLTLLSELLNDEQNINNSTDWEALRKQIKSSYSIDSEIAMFDAVMKGASVEEALDLFRAQLNEASNEQAIELF